MLISTISRTSTASCSLALFDGVHGSEPWISDGTAAGTFMLGDLNPGPDDSLLIAESVVVNADGIFFSG